MRFDPAADPWGTAMLAAAALWLLSLLVMLAALLARTSRRTGGYLMLVSLLAFLGAAAGGTWARLQGADPVVAEASPSPPEGEEIAAKAREDLGGSAAGSGAAADEGASERGTGDEGATGGTADGETRGEPTGAAASDATGGDGASGDATAGEPAAGSTGADDPTGGSTGEPDPTGGEEPAGDTAGRAEPEPEPAVAGEPVVPEDLPKVEPLPDEPRAREAAIREILDEAGRAAGGGERCGNLQRVAKAWAQLQTIPVTRKAKSVTKDLERCRRRLLYSISQKRLAEMIEDRDAWFAKLPGKLRKQHGLVIQAALSGSSHQRLRIGNRELDPERADALMDAGLRDELTGLQFAHVVISSGKQSKTYELPVTPEGELGLPWLRAVGLGEPLRLAE